MTINKIIEATDKWLITNFLVINVKRKALLNCSIKVNTTARIKPFTKYPVGKYETATNNSLITSTITNTKTALFFRLILLIQK